MRSAPLRSRLSSHSTNRGNPRVCPVLLLNDFVSTNCSMTLSVSPHVGDHDVDRRTATGDGADASRGGLAVDGRGGHLAWPLRAIGLAGQAPGPCRPNGPARPPQTRAAPRPPPP